MITSEEVSVSVDVAGAAERIAGTLNVPDGARTIQLLVHGFTYDRAYWDFPYEPETYSYVRRANAAGYATLAIDRVGAGASSRPPSRRLTWPTAATTVHQVVEAIRRGDLGSFDKVILVGHSYGSVTSYRVADRFGGVDALIATGLHHRVSIPSMTWRIAMRAKPLRKASPLHPNGPLYVTTWDGRRQWCFNHTNTDPGLLQRDEELRRTAGLLELPTALLYVMTPVSKTTNIPTLTVIGDQDPLFALHSAGDCSSDEALADFERPFYGPRATVEAAVIRGAGHCLTLELQAPIAADRMLDFCDRHVGAGLPVSSRPPPAM